MIKEKSSEKIKMATEKIKISEFLIQCAATMCISFLGCQSGFICSWPSYTTAIFKSNETVLSMPMSSTHISLLGSLSNVGGLLISPFCSYAFNTFGRKYATVLFGLPFVLAWVIISFSSNVYLILLAMALVGVGIAGQSVSIIFISEISHDSIRGGLSACPSSGYFLGLLISNFMGGHLSYMQVVYTFLSSSVLAVVLLLLLKESPVYLVLVGKEKEAAKSISFYRRLDETSKEVEAEISKIKLQLDPRLESTLQGANDEPEAAKQLITAKEPIQQTKKISSWSFLKKSKSSQRSLLLIIILMSITSMMGPIMLQVYAESIFMEAVPSLDPNQCAVGVGLVFMVASLVCILAVDRCGRQSLLIYTSIACGICALLLGSLLQLYWAPEWFAALLIYGYCFSYTMGCATTPFVLMAEIFLPEVRSLCNTLILASLWIVNFFTLGSFNHLVEWLGLPPVFYIFSMICFVVAIYTKIYIPETKGMSVTEIQKLFVKDKTARSMEF